jgi:hypothetical protein
MRKCSAVSVRKWLEGPVFAAKRQPAAPWLTRLPNSTNVGLLQNSIRPVSAAMGALHALIADAVRGAESRLRMATTPAWLASSVCHLPRSARGAHIPRFLRCVFQRSSCARAVGEPRLLRFILVSTLAP